MRWKLALAQHPMYLLIREDTQCAERTPPWGAPTIEAYIERIRQNLDSLERYPQLKLGYEWSGVELELLASDSPEVCRSCAVMRTRAGFVFTTALTRSRTCRHSAPIKPAPVPIRQAGLPGARLGPGESVRASRGERARPGSAASSSFWYSICRCPGFPHYPVITGARRDAAARSPRPALSPGQ